MNIHELFEQYYSEHNAIRIDVVSGCRLSNGSYNNLPIAKAFRSFRAGFEAKSDSEMQILGYLSEIGALRASQGSAAYFKKSASGSACIPVYVNQSETHKTGENHGKQ